MQALSKLLFAGAALCALAILGCGGSAPVSMSLTKSRPSSVLHAQRLVKAVPPAQTPATPLTGTQSAVRASIIPALSLLANSGFEIGTAHWISSDEVIDSDENVASEGTGYAWLGGDDSRGDFLRQDVVLPENAEQISLQFDVGVVSDEGSTATAHDVMNVEVIDVLTGVILGRLATYTNVGADSRWHQSASFDLTKYKNKRIALLFSATTDETEPTSFFLDEIKLLARVNDVVTFAGPRSSFTLEALDGGRVVATDLRTGKASSFSGAKRFVFSDAVIVTDLAGPPAKLYRLYQAAFNRVPDVAGLGYWITLNDNQLSNLDQVAQAFMASSEFKSMYGQPSTVQFVTLLYNNVLHRAPDAAGLAFHKGTLDSGSLTRSQVLMDFANSAENVEQILPRIANGFQYAQPPGMASAATPAQPATIPRGNSAEVLDNGLVLPVWENCPAGYEVMKDSKGNPMTYGGGACVKKAGGGSITPGTGGTLPPTNGGTVPPSNGGTTPPGNTNPGGSTPCKFMNSAKQCIEPPMGYVGVPGPNPDRTYKTDICNTMQAIGYPVQLTTCSQADGLSGYYIIRNNGPVADICWTITYSGRNPSKGCRFSVSPGNHDASLCRECGLKMGGPPKMELTSYKVK